LSERTGDNPWRFSLLVKETDSTAGMGDEIFSKLTALYGVRNWRCGWKRDHSPSTATRQENEWRSLRCGKLGTETLKRRGQNLVTAETCLLYSGLPHFLNCKTQSI
jgi:hypothetical protein